MRVPFVTREQYTAVVAAEARANERYERLLTLYHDLKLHGATSAPVQAQIVPQAMLPKLERDDVFDAIELQAGNDPTLKRHLTRWAKTQQLEGTDQTDIINAILHWQSDDE